MQVDTVVAKKEEGFEGKPTFVQKFSQLWLACYFERKLTKQKVQDTDLAQIVESLIHFFEQEQIDFRRAVPLLQGLHNLFLKKMSFLLKDSESLLTEMKNPIGVKEEEDGGKATKKKSNTHKTNANFKLNPKDFDWFLSGID